ncbi:MAG: DUF3276 family protein [Bacteroidetes bacterium]|nr:MAG: DUF3276 family protein [Bacteroidota bacterium]REJ99763.1 MAG: DUF3276 family protein [Bacteroidota bacterium]REK34136.1 MAG: DUF3276 family protein [Bacteroidota bacterium]REK50466.1 MAG: DUF3276 family protein [Bacteroidota bacterium]
MSDRNSQRDREEVFSKSVRAGKRTYFFDVKSTKSNDYYLTITESKKRQGDDGVAYYEKHKIFLYREDFQKFIDGLNEAVGHVGTLKVDAPEHHYDRERDREQDSGNTEKPSSTFTDVNFDDLG